MAWKMMIHLQHLRHYHWLVLLSNNQGLDFKCLPIRGVLFEMSELSHRRFLFCIKDGHQQLCWRVNTCKLRCNCLVGHRETEVLAGKAFARKGSVTAACFFQFVWKRATTNLTSSQIFLRISVETTQPAKSLNGQTGEAWLCLCTLLTVTPMS